MTTAATLAQGTLLRYGGGPTTIAEVLSISGPTLTRDTIDVTNHDSSGGYREFINGLLDGGEVTFDVNYLPANATHDASTGLLSIYESGALTAFTLVFTDVGNTEWTFNGVVTGFEISAGIDEQLKASCTIKVSGQPTLA